jgi:hypothetical protein
MNTFYCPYDLAIQTMDAIWQSKQKAIVELKAAGYSDDEIDDLIIIGVTE